MKLVEFFWYTASVDISNCRCQTYKSILNAFDELYDKSSDQPHPLPTEPGPPAQPDPNALTADQAKHLVCRNNMIFIVAFFVWNIVFFVDTT